MLENNDGITGLGLIGIVAATVLSWMKWHSVGYAILHALCGWAYVAYYLIRYGMPS
jgi:hypothetical protein